MVNEKPETLGPPAWKLGHIYQPSGAVSFELFDESHPDHAEFVERSGRCYADHDHEVWLRSFHVNCWCWACEDLVSQAYKQHADTVAMWNTFFVVCPDCGNKRCPKVSNHDLACSGSNTPGQPGSVYQ